MKRREFLQGATRMLLVLPIGTFLIHCTGGGETVVTTSPTQPDTTPPDAPPQVVSDSIIYTSSETNLHSHSFTVPRSQLATPTGVAGVTTDAQAHNHTVTITADELRRASNGEAVKVVTASTVGHTHVLTIVRI